MSISRHSPDRQVRPGLYLRVPKGTSFPLDPADGRSAAQIDAVAGKGEAAGTAEAADHLDRAIRGLDLDQDAVDEGPNPAIGAEAETYGLALHNAPRKSSALTTEQSCTSCVGVLCNRWKTD